MFKNLFKGLVVFTLGFILSCANRGTPSGGDKDVTPPQIIKTIPENFSTNFNANEIRIYFDEFVKIKDVQRQLIISPPMDPEPVITPVGSASKYIKIKILDTLQANTTYALNFGQSIVDNNEENPYSYYKYVFSTGNYIDSLSVKGIIVDAEMRRPDKFVSVMLYDVDSTYTDSIVYKQKPKYVTNTLDSLTTFNLENLKAGTYLLVALKDENNNNTFQQKTDKIGFNDTLITIPTDSVYTLKLFKEELDFKALTPRQVSGQKIAFGYEGDAKDMQITLGDNQLKGIEKRITKDSESDTLYYWYRPKIELDSTIFVVKNKMYADTLIHRFRDLEKDSLTLKALQSGTLNFDQNFLIRGSIPFVSVNKNNVTILDKDSLNVDFKIELNELDNNYSFNFDKSESNTYKLQMLPETFTDFFGNVNKDTLNYNLRTKSYADFSNLRVTLINAKYPLIIQLTDEKGVVKYEQYSTKNNVFDFRYINPVNYYLRVVHDVNGNKKWDTGNYLKKIQPEHISYYPKLIDETRANWDPIIEFTLE